MTEKEKKLLVERIIRDIKNEVGWLVNSKPTMLNKTALSTIQSILEVNLDRTLKNKGKK